MRVGTRVRYPSRQAGSLTWKYGTVVADRRNNAIRVAVELDEGGRIMRSLSELSEKERHIDALSGRQWTWPPPGAQ